jgi:adenylate kinase
MKILLIWPQGSWKWTQAEKIEEKYWLKHVSTGDLFRYHMKNQTDLWKTAKNYIDQWQLVPDEIVNNMLFEAVKNETNFLIDWYPRNMWQAHVLDSMIEIDKVIELSLKRQEVLQRLSSRMICRNCWATYNLLYNPPEKEWFCDKEWCEWVLYQREDDKPETINKRLDIYYTTTAPILKYYREKLISINGSQPIDEVFKNIEIKLDEIKI